MVYSVDNFRKIELIEVCYKSIPKNLKILKIKQFPHLWDLNSEIKLKQISISSQKENFKTKKNSQCSKV